MSQETTPESELEVRDGKIWQMTEYWPDPFEAAAWRAPLIDPMAPTFDDSAE